MAAQPQRGATPRGPGASGWRAAWHVVLTLLVAAALPRLAGATPPPPWLDMRGQYLSWRLEEADVVEFLAILRNAGEDAFPGGTVRYTWRVDPGAGGVPFVQERTRELGFVRKGQLMLFRLPYPWPAGPTGHLDRPDLHVSFQLEDDGDPVGNLLETTARFATSNGSRIVMRPGRASLVVEGEEVVLRWRVLTQPKDAPCWSWYVVAAQGAEGEDLEGPASTTWGLQEVRWPVPRDHCPGLYQVTLVSEARCRDPSDTVRDLEPLVLRFSLPLGPDDCPSKKRRRRRRRRRGRRAAAPRPSPPPAPAARSGAPRRAGGPDLAPPPPPPAKLLPPPGHFGAWPARSRHP